MALTHVITYDISENARRARVAAILQAYGDRIQRSVFVCTLEPDALRQLCDRISQTINPNTDSIHVFRQCGSCWDAATAYGQATIIEEPLYWAVM